MSDAPSLSPETVASTESLIAGMRSRLEDTRLSYPEKQHLERAIAAQEAILGTAKATVDYRPPAAPASATVAEQRAGLTAMSPDAYERPRPNEHADDAALTTLAGALAKANVDRYLGTAVLRSAAEPPTPPEKLAARLVSLGRDVDKTLDDAAKVLPGVNVTKLGLAAIVHLANHAAVLRKAGRLT